MNYYMYVGDYHGLTIYDISNPFEIYKFSQFNTTDKVRLIVIKENLAYIAAEEDGLIIINITNPLLPDKLSQYNINVKAWDTTLKGDLAYIANANITGGQLTIMDVSTPQNPILAGTFKHPDVTLNIKMKEHPILIT